VITAESTAVFPENLEVVWAGDGVATLSVRRKDATTLIVWEHQRPRRQEANETYAVTAGGCAGAMPKGHVNGPPGTYFL
jgi:hypothetical protein